MSLINVGDFPIDPFVVDGVELAARLNRLKLAIYSGLSNATRPPDITAGGTWVKFTAPSTYTLMLFNGTTDAAVAVGDVTSGTIALPFNTATNYKKGDLIFDAATGTLQSAKYDIASGSAYNAGDWNTNQNIAATFVKKVGDTMTGPLVLSGNAAAALEAVPKQQLDAAILAAGMPSGAVAFFAMNTAPAGWLKANGALVSRTTYAALFAAIGTTYGAGDGSTTFKLPEVRGEFLRCWDDGRGIDTGRIFGSAQLDAFQGHRHQQSGGQTATGVAGGVGTLADGPFSGFTGLYTAGAAADDMGAVRNALETRPRNIAFLACIKT